MRRAWGVHFIVVLFVLLPLVLLLAAFERPGSTGFALALAFFLIPLGVVYTLTSTLLVALLRPGHGSVALAHAIALVLGGLSTGIWLR